MNFVYEPMSIEGWKVLVRKRHRGPYPAGKPLHWVVDHENDVQFVSLGGRGSMPANCDLPPNFYVLIWKKQIVRFESRYTSEISNDKESIFQDVFSTCAPKALEPEAIAIREAIPQALLVNWRGLYAGHRTLLVTVHVNLSTINFV